MTSLFVCPLHRQSRYCVDLMEKLETFPQAPHNRRIIKMQHCGFMDLMEKSETFPQAPQNTQ